jgi:hypothetical protein
VHLSKRREPVGNLGIFRSDLSVDAVCTQRACAGLKTEGGGAGASFRARATLGRRAFSGRLNVACVGPRVQRVVDAFGKLVNSPLANTFPDRYLHRSVERLNRSVERLRSLFEALLFSFVLVVVRAAPPVSRACRYFVYYQSS